jgi:Na+-driven multidrug efflux pump
VAQNFGAADHARVRMGMQFSLRSSLIYGVAAAALMGGLAMPLAGLSSEQAAVVATTACYLWIMPAS